MIKLIFVFTLIPMLCLSQWDTSHVTLNGVNYGIAKNKTDKGTLVFKKTQTHLVLSLENITITGDTKKITYVFKFMGGKTTEYAIGKVAADHKSIVLENQFENKKYRAYFRDCEKLEITIQGNNTYTFDMTNGYSAYKFVKQEK